MAFYCGLRASPSSSEAGVGPWNGILQNRTLKGGRIDVKCESMPLYLIFFLLLAFNGVQAGDKWPSLMSVPDDLKATTSLTEEGQALAAFNFIQDGLYRPHLSAVTYDPASDHLYWKEPLTGQPMSMDRGQFMTEIWYPYFLWHDHAWTISKYADPVQLAKTGDATDAFNYVQENREDTLKHPPVDQVWFDETTQLFHWKGPKTGKEMNMGRDQFLKEIYYPYSLWIGLHNPS
jgi:hypothetical protein